MKVGRGWQLLSANQRWKVTLCVSQSATNTSASTLGHRKQPGFADCLRYLASTLFSPMIRFSVVRATSPPSLATKILGFVKTTLCNSLPVSSLHLRAYIGTMSPHNVAPSTPDTDSRQHELQYNNTKSAPGDLNNTASIRKVEKSLPNLSLPTARLLCPRKRMTKMPNTALFHLTCDLCL